LANYSTTDGAAGGEGGNVARRKAYSAAAPARKAGGGERAPRQATAESLMLWLRTIEGMTRPAGFEAELTGLGRAGLVERSNGRVVPTRRGLDLHNQIALSVL